MNNNYITIILSDNNYYRSDKWSEINEWKTDY